MGRYTTLTEEIARYQSLTGIQNQPPCGCEKQDKEIITSSSMEESTDKDHYEDVVFLQGSEADEALFILDERGEDAALEYLKQWHDYGSHMGSDKLGHGTEDRVYKKDGYVMSWNPRLNYIGLQYDLHYNEAAPQEQPKELDEIIKCDDAGECNKEKRELQADFFKGLREQMNDPNRQLLRIQEINKKLLKG